MLEKIPEKKVAGAPKPEEVEALTERVRRRKSGPISFPQEAQPTEEILELEKPAEPELPEVEFEEIKEEKPTKRRYAEGDPVIFDKATKDKEFLNYLITKAEVKSSELNLDKPTPQNMEKVVKLYEEFKAGQAK
ncbi:MAG: hypothetical protein UY12_C0022G0004 [Parcubacteria group bacterium GW2011_GWA2_47_8b]|uniref:Uncharacterized protein n=3 Tax=Parcubacteria group TaxID=1794811 RepID=A0A0G1W365_9BACT|nr:MAG: hypothetical protein UY02_C0013G0006 [Candidatus Giovannonibacteria bacterium GW2011_GWB1_47_6b]KKU84618.1 MAG: hypothetical protein UY12_C0022G0004 [Parcubacteria group bacterium GW2011_GWA2_47_8b]KKU92840.1 MAG: hypothetical protein UY24_C0028G0002 [Parcubacteria group bacterium GW2011_GWA1_48_11b]OGY63741.1 MAG: hypothetical protein A3E64_02340 [Candidatus Harrisonbacteria bacterium RIFCSPHIGHO2_12_FULL_48_16]OGY68992.1 MAG: hypothetical protein A2214_00165 [Candidatus Harrisonbacter